VISWGDVETVGVKINGFKILESQYPTDYTDEEGNPLWVRPPAYPDNATGKFHNIFFASESVWNELEALIMRKYSEVLSGE
jgi:hypothetical protein